ncbi:TetR/AcrR family transcriptional regulator [Amycolatopsis minnesotensis]|uniref:HTH tetR-type domain-containing protein n=1 Tax=Amycolatopsis minnesotensis TaxID=337894 RepID=A0ABN2PZV4_9PSEU
MGTQTRQRIIEAAVRLFAERGVAATPVTAVEAEAGLSAGSGGFYRHFKDKGDLLADVVTAELARVRKVPPPNEPASSPAGALSAQLRSDLDFLAELRPLITILFWERGKMPDIAERIRTTMLERGIELGVADLLLRSPSGPVIRDPVAAAAVMQSAMVGYFLAIEYFGAAPADVDATRFTATLADLLTAAEAGAR